MWWSSREQVVMAGVPAWTQLVASLCPGGSCQRQVARSGPSRALDCQPEHSALSQTHVLLEARP